jgi:hypothetical protein
MTRKTIPLRSLLDNELTSYVAAAKGNASTNRRFVAAAISVIAVGSISLAPTLHAEIVYTPANKNVGGVSGWSSLPIDLNNDGTVDVVVSAYEFVSFSSGFHARGELAAFGVQGNQVLVEGSYDDAVPGVMGQRIGFPASARFRFEQDGLMVSEIHSDGTYSSFNTTRGLWLGVTNRYLGIKFLIDGEVHYGWARFSTDGAYTLTGYAYETIPDKPIPAGVFETPPEESGANSTEGATAGSLGALALGAARR